MMVKISHIEISGLTGEQEITLENEHVVVSGKDKTTINGEEMEVTYKIFLSKDEATRFASRVADLTGAENR